MYINKSYDQCVKTLVRRKEVHTLRIEENGKMRSNGEDSTYFEVPFLTGTEMLLDLS